MVSILENPAPQEDKEHPRVAFFIPSLEGGGAERVFVTLANNFSAAGYPVDLLVVRRIGPYLAKLSDRVRVVDLAKQRTTAALIPLFQYLRRVTPAVLFTALSSANVVALAARRLAGKPTRIIVTVHSLLAAKEHSATTLKGRILIEVAKAGYRWADELVAVSEGVAADLEQHAGVAQEWIHIIHNPIDIDEIEREAQALPSHPWLQESEPPLIVSAGRLVEQKDFSTLVRAFARVCRRRPVRLVILGDGPRRLRLEALIEQQDIEASVCLPGFVGNPYVFMSSASVFVLSSRWEAFGNVLVEAMACGTPVVSTDCPGGPSEILGSGQYGRLVPVGDESALAKAICKALDTPMSSEALAQRARAFNIQRGMTAYRKLVNVK